MLHSCRLGNCPVTQSCRACSANFCSLAVCKRRCTCSLSCMRIHWCGPQGQVPLSNSAVLASSDSIVWVRLRFLNFRRFCVKKRCRAAGSEGEAARDVGWVEEGKGEALRAECRLRPATSSGAAPAASR